MKKIYFILILTLQSIFSSAERHFRTPSFWSPKNIFFSTLIHGSSHTTWVLEIGQELAAKGHNFTFICRSYSERYLRDYPTVNLLPIIGEDPVAEYDKFAVVLQQKEYNIELMRILFSLVQKTFREDYLQYSKYFQEYKPDVVLCDAFIHACIYAADENKIPVIVTSTMAVSEDASASFVNNLLIGNPTTEHESLWTRFYNKYIFGVKLLWTIQKTCSEKIALQQELGIPSNQVLPHKMKDSVKLVNNFFGMEPARPLGPLVRFAGPILSSSYPTLDERNAEFLNAHERVAYIAFGHHSISAPHELQNLWLALIDSIETNIFDGFFWVIRDTSNFPEIVTSTLGTKVNVSDIINNGGKYPHYQFSEWAPQFAILSHPSTALFITHGGANSLFESLYNSKMMLFHPYFGDQGTNVKMLEKAGVGLVYDRFSSNAKDMVRKIKLIVEDEEGRFARNVRRMSALVQLKAAEAIPNAISTIEEVIFSSNVDEVPHLYPASRNMSYIKANNIDLQFILLCLASILLFLTYSTCRVLYRALYNFFYPFFILYSKLV
ncbi:hypothetical protein K450DRAFT_200661 [Umbelopsis ramanniana AG]|uniref:UDP-glycosyltransferases domain-containing protein n=1 Tax=Umbelopsis ramanniana AG TaxID=1314678 RepID=A0AAD5E863_UMBRA|nr:uncharacterized protein K450DRAFT_200661 [Umbelopsis ramanniana AG]KAI8578111.1 hypothetical protein K450DRAFT_200661 [Umbelopsis ramanniana AG]